MRLGTPSLSVFQICQKINSLEVNQTEAKVISKERNYANKPEELVRSFSLCMLSLDLGRVSPKED